MSRGRLTSSANNPHSPVDTWCACGNKCCHECCRAIRRSRDLLTGTLCSRETSKFYKFLSNYATFKVNSYGDICRWLEVSRGCPCPRVRAVRRRLFCWRRRRCQFVDCTGCGASPRCSRRQWLRCESPLGNLDSWLFLADGTQFVISKKFIRKLEIAQSRANFLVV